MNDTNSNSPSIDPRSFTVGGRGTPEEARAAGYGVAYSPSDEPPLLTLNVSAERMGELVVEHGTKATAALNALENFWTDFERRHQLGRTDPALLDKLAEDPAAMERLQLAERRAKTASGNARQVADAVSRESGGRTLVIEGDEEIRAASLVPLHRELVEKASLVGIRDELRRAVQREDRAVIFNLARALPARLEAKAAPLPDGRVRWDAEDAAVKGEIAALLAKGRSLLRDTSNDGLREKALGLQSSSERTMRIANHREWLRGQRAREGNTPMYRSPV